MKNNDPFLRRPASAIDKILHVERERADLIKRALGPSYSFHEQLQSMQSPPMQFAELQKLGIFDEIEKSRRLYEDQFRSINQIMKSDWISSIATAATTLRLYDFGRTERLRMLSTQFDGSVLSLAKQLDGKSSFVASALAASKWQSTWQSLAEQITPNLSAFRAIAEGALTLEMAMQRASTGHTTSATQFLAEQAVEAQRLAEALVQTEAPDESARLFIAFVGVLAAIFDHFKGNTVEELRKLGLLGILLIALTIMTLPQLQPDPEMSAEDRQQYLELHAEIASLKNMMQEFVETESSLNEAFISSLPRGELNRRSNIRRAPKRDAPKIMIAEPETIIAIIRSQGRWKEIMFHDPLTDQLSQGWVYGTSVSTFD